MKLLLTTLTITFVMLTRCVTADNSDQCQLTRAAFDIGSGTTRLKVAEVDICEHKILQTLAEEQIKVGYADDLSQSDDNKFSEDVQQKGLAALRLLKELASRYKPDQYVGGATAAFREADNGKSFVKKIRDQLQIEADVLTARQEGILGYLGVVATSKVDADKVVVWDIGGGSKQLTALAPDQESFLVYSDGYASVSYKNAVIEKVKGLDPQRVDSPNPIGKSNLQPATKLVDATVSNIPEHFVELLRDPATQVIGIGGVHYYSIRNQSGVEGETYTRDQVHSALKERIEWSDKKLGGSYASTDVTNLLLVYAYMEKLGIDRIRTAKVNIADGLAVYDPEKV